MKIIQNGFECEKKLRDLACSFFDRDEEVYLKTSFFETDEKISAKTEIFYNNKKFDFEYIHNVKNNDIYKKYKNKYNENAILKSFYGCVKKIKDITLPWGVMCGVRPAKNVRSFIEDGFSKEEIFDIFKELYDVDDEKIKLAIDVAENESILLENIGDKSVSIYIGIPFCPTRCLYCSFVSTDIRVSGKYMSDFVEKLLIEIEQTAKIIKEKGLYIENIYIGGGTPTALDEENLELLLKKAYEEFYSDKIKEYTLEAGRVDTINEKKLKIAKKYGVNRISINPQTMKNETLEYINRRHTCEDIERAFKLAKNVGFCCINADLIAGLPNERIEDFKNSLEKVIALEPENITIHTMCVKRAAQLRFSKINLTEGKTVSDMLEYAQKRLKNEGFEPYYMYRQKYMIGNLENVGYSKKGFMSVYNVNIMEEKQTIIALGGGGSTKIVGKNSIERIFNFKDPVEYIRRFDEILERKNIIRDKIV